MKGAGVKVDVVAIYIAWKRLLIIMDPYLLEPTRKKAEVKGAPTFHDTHIYTNETFNPDNVIWPCQSVQSFMPKNDQIMGLWDWELAHDFWNQRQIIMTNEPAWEVKTHSLTIAIILYLLTYFLWFMLIDDADAECCNVII